MKVAIVAPAPSPPVNGGTERAVDGVCRALDVLESVEAEVVKLAVDESSLPALIDAYERFSNLDLSAYDRIISVKYPAWMVDHPHHSIYLFHPLRGLYDTYHRFGLPRRPAPETILGAQLLELTERTHTRAALADFFGLFSQLVDVVPRDAADLAFPGPLARAFVHWLDRVAMAPDRIVRYFALSRTVAARPGYFPSGVEPVVVPLPGDLPARRPDPRPGIHLFTASRLDAPKRLDLLIDSMAYVDAEVPLRIAGRGPLEDDLRSRAADDPRIEFLGYVPDEDLGVEYRRAMAVPFVPEDEDLGLISVEAGAQGAPVVTCTDSGGPTEFVADGVNGLVCDPNPVSLGRALTRIAADPPSARRMGYAAYRKASSLTWAGVATTLLGRDGSPTGSESLDPSRTVVTSTTGRRIRVVSLATYGIDGPAHGGQLRVHHLCRALARQMDVHQLALDANAQTVTTTEITPGLDCTVMPRHQHQTRIEDSLGIQSGQPVTDIMSGIDAHLNPEFLSRLHQFASEADLVVLEQPFLHPALERAGVQTPFVVNTQNVERDLRAATLTDSPLRDHLVDLIGQIEAHALTEAVAVTACSPEDARRLGELYGIDPSQVTLVPNGTVIPERTPTIEERTRAGQQWIRRYCWNSTPSEAFHLGVFFGSWHPPNLDAAEFLIQLASEMPHLLIVSAGDHGRAFASRDLPGNIIFPGPVTARAKDVLLDSATVALNPMRTGSGTNLKIIEFLAHGVPTVSTPFGARGLGLCDGRDLLFAEPGAFVEAIEATITDPEATTRRVRAGRRFIEHYDWQEIGSRYRDRLTSLVCAPTT